MLRAISGSTVTFIFWSHASFKYRYEKGITILDKEAFQVLYE